MDNETTKNAGNSKAEVHKTCTACNKPYTLDEWNALPALGAPMVVEEDGVVYSLQLKNCECRGTMGVEHTWPAARAA